MSWLTLTHVELDGSTLQARFRPSEFAPEIDAPVVEVTVEGAEDPEGAISALARFQDDFVVDLVVECRELRVLGEMDAEETVVRGTKVASRMVPYSLGELRDIAGFFARALQEANSKGYRQAAKLQGVRHFVSDLIERSEKRRSLSHNPQGANDPVADALRRVLHKLDAA